MPTPEQILAGLEKTANQWLWLAIFWHIYLGAFIFALLLGRRPSLRFTGIFLAVPLFSVSALSWYGGNPFNGSVFFLAGAVSIGISLTLPRTPVALSHGWAVLAGLLLFAFGWLYPHFLEHVRWWMYLYAAPTGLIPCPTLSALTGLMLMLGGLQSRSGTLVLVITGIFYGLFGAFRLGVTIDWVLLAGALLFGFHVFFTDRPGTQH